MMLHAAYKTILFWMLAMVCTPHAYADMIRGLDQYPSMNNPDMLRSYTYQGKVNLLSGETFLPYDEVSNTYFIPQERNSKDFDGIISVDAEEGYTYFIESSQDFSKQSALDYSMGITVYGIKNHQYISSKIVFTPLPVLCINTETGETPGDLEEKGELQIYTAQGGQLLCENVDIKINLRGNTSKWLPKQSYRVKIIDDIGNKQNISLCNLRSDDDWILNPMYSDTSKIREKLAYWLWDQINSVGYFAKSSRLEYAEIILHGEYWGLYGIQERIDRKQVDASRKTGILYKVFANEKPTADEFASCTDAERCGGFEVKYTGKYAVDFWKPAGRYISFLEGDLSLSESSLSLQNVIDYGLWAMLVQAHDCHFKNQFLNCVYTSQGYVMYKIPWDLNNTFGDVWLLDSKEENYTGYRLGKLVMDGAFGRLIETKDPDIYAEIVYRYRQLRESGIVADNIILYAREIHEPIYAAIVRDGKRWPKCGMGDGNANNIRDIETSLNDILYRMDRWIESLEKSI